MVKRFKIAGIPADFFSMPFGRQIEYHHILSNFKANSKSIHLSQKRQSYQKAIKEAIALYSVDEYYCEFHCDSLCKDDSFQFWYR